MFLCWACVVNGPGRDNEWRENEWRGDAGRESSQAARGICDKKGTNLLLVRKRYCYYDVNAMIVIDEAQEERKRSARGDLIQVSIM